MAMMHFGLPPMKLIAKNASKYGPMAWPKLTGSGPPSAEMASQIAPDLLNMDPMASAATLMSILDNEAARQAYLSQFRRIGGGLGGGGALGGASALGLAASAGD